MLDIFGGKQILAERGAYLQQRDEALGERAAYLLQRDEALGERNEYLRQLTEARKVVLSPRRNHRDEIERLTRTIDDAVIQPSSIFFHAVDYARTAFRDALSKKRDPDALEDAVLGIKLINLLVAKHEYMHGRVVTTARPVGFMLDPANQCHLGCPSCTNTYNTGFSERVFNPWPRGMMSEKTFDSFWKENAAFAFSGHFYNNHEPLLNKLTPSFVRRAADLRVRTFISSNLSFRQIDAEAIVASGLTELMVAADGVTQSVYEGYRRGGRIEWVLANARAIVEAKRRMGSATPIMRWQYLTFNHNVHEVPRAIELAREIGFDSFNLATPNEVKYDDPSIDRAVYAGPDEHKQVFFTSSPRVEFKTDLSPHRDLIENILAESALERWQRETGGREPSLDEDKTGERCDWLHLGVISDAMGRIVPCCNGDYRGQGRFVFANIESANGNLMNSESYRSARQILVDPASERAQNSELKTSDRVVCAKCPARPTPQVGLGAVAAYLAELPSSCSDAAYLYNWSRHTPLEKGTMTNEVAEGEM